MKPVLFFVLRMYRIALSPFLGNACRFYPSCSRYAEEAVSKKGFWAGGAQSIVRILRCHPFHPGGFDPVE